MEQKDRGDRITIHAGKDGILPFGQRNKSQNEDGKQNQDGCSPQESLLLAYGTEDKVGILLRDVLEFGLRPVKESFARQATGTDSYLGLIHIIARPAGVILQSQRDLDTYLLVRFQYLVKYVVDRKEKSNRCQREKGNQGIPPYPLVNGHAYQIGHIQSQDAQYDPVQIEGKEIANYTRDQENSSRTIRHPACRQLIFTLY